MDFIKINNIYSSKDPIKSMRVGELINNLYNQNKRPISWTYKKEQISRKKDNSNMDKRLLQEHHKRGKPNSNYMKR